MATGTGLPILKSGEVRTQATPVISADAFSNAQAWAALAKTGAVLGKEASDLARLDIHQRQVGYLADHENEISRKRADLSDQFRDDPAGFDAAWKGYSDGKIGQAEPWAIPHLQRTMGAQGNAAYSGILATRRREDERLDAERIDTLAKGASGDYVGSAMAGVPDQTKLEKLKGVLATAVTSRLMTQEKADLLLDETAGRAQGEVAARDGVATYREQGYEAAVSNLRKNILENETLGLKPAEKQRVFNRGLEAINLQRRVDREDRVGIVQDVQDTIARLKSNQPVESGTIKEQLDAAKRVGAMSAYRDLYVEQTVNELTAPYRSGAVRPADFARTIGAAREGAIQGTPAQAAAITTAASRLGVRPQDLAAAISYETGGTFNPNMWGGKGGNYLGLIQFGPEERAKYGVRPGMTFEQQMGAVENFLRDRGVKPGMGISDIYRTINGGNPNVSLNASDGNGTIAQHIQRIQQGHYANADKFLGGKGVLSDADPYAGTIVQRAQKVFAEQMKKEWPDFKKAIDAGKDFAAEDFDAVRMAAAVSGDAAWIRDVEDAYTAEVVGKVIGAAPLGQGQVAIDEVKQKFSDNVLKSVQSQFDRRLKLVTEAPVDFAVENGRAPPAPLDFSSSQTLRAAIQERVEIARSVAQDQQVPSGNPFRPAETAAIAGAIVGGTAQQAAAALSALRALPDDMIVPALKNADIRNAIVGTARSNDAARYNAAMSFGETLRARDPDLAGQILGSDLMREVSVWQRYLRYQTPDQQIKLRDQAKADPQARARREAAEREAQREASKLDVNDITKLFDESWPITPSFVAQGRGTQPLAPIDPGTKEAFSGDFDVLYTKLRADGLEPDAAKEETIKLMRQRWRRSGANGGRLMPNAPENYYPAINASHDWMAKQVRDEAAKYLSLKDAGTLSAGVGVRDPGALDFDVALVSDRRTETDAQAGRPPSYIMVVTDKRTGHADVSYRIIFDPSADLERARAAFAAERERALNPPKGISRNMPAIN